ncbi:hypothetical protein K461DRAFT_295334 [Myriangium duriaei CBS 260.36]|uniref:DUF6987 domain-containing protein n=1 Tax=Myriangium duriaei CBS 260.36 TaxID=1168546 RepID=A0A9P4J2L8_9PEZI|nr:hypothetical protein K461DRAFT_295334 [Myriangium duriaei CBS 260.36]
MGPTPTAGKAASGAPKTPTKLGRKPQSSQTPKLGQSSSTPGNTSQGVRKASSTAQSAGSKATGTAGDLSGKAQGAAQGAKDTAEDTAKDAKDDVEGIPEGASRVEMKDDEEDEGSDADEGPLSKVTEAKEGAEDQASQATESAENLAGKAKDTAKDTADDVTESAEDTAEDTADDATEKAGDDAEGDETETGDDATDAGKKVAGDAKDSAGGVLSGAKGLAGKAQGLAGKTAKDPSKAAEGAKDTAEEATEDVQDTAEGATGDAQKVAGDAGEAVEEATEDAQDTAKGATKDAEEAADDAQGTAEDATDDLPEQSELPLDLSVLKGLEVQPDGTVEGPDGPIGKLVEGDAEDLAGYPIGDDGEILDDDGDLVGRVELLPDTVKKQLLDLKEKGELPEEHERLLEQIPEADEAGDGAGLPGLDILKGLTCDPTGLIFNEEGDTIGQVTDGDPQELMNATLNEHGEFVDDDGNVIGHADIHPEAADIAQQADETAEGAADEAEGAAEGIEDQLPGVEALQGRELNEAGEIVDNEGNVLGQLEGAESLKGKLEAGDINPEDLKINEEGQVVDADGNVLGTVGLAEGAAEKLKEATSPQKLDLRILDGRKVNKKGKVLDEEGEEIGELTEGDASKCAGKKVNDKGEVLDKDGNVIGKVSIVPGEAAETATKELLQELGELEEEPSGPQFKIPDLDILDGLKVNKKGKVLDEDGEEIGELSQGEISECAGKKINEKGEVLDSDGNIIGRVKTIPKELTQEEIDSGVEGLTEDALEAAGDAEGAAEDAEGAKEDAEGAADEAAEAAEEAGEEGEDAGDGLPPLSILEGLTVNKSGKLIDSNGTVVGELVEGDAKKLSKSGVTADAEGQFWDNKGHIIGKAKTVPQEDPEEESPFAGLEGLLVTKDGYVEDENGNRVGKVTEGDAKKLVGRAVDEDGDIIDKRGTVVGHAERWEEEEVEEQAPEAIDLSDLEGRTLNKAGVVIGDEGVPIARLVEGNAKELAGRKLDGEGQIWNDSGKVVGRVELIPENEREAKPEGPFAGLQGLRVVADGKIADEDENIVGQIVEGNPKRLIGLAVDEDGDIVDKYGNVKGHAEPLPEEEEEVIDNSILDGKKLNKQGFVVNEEGIPIGKLVEGNVKELAGRRCDEEGLIHGDTGKVVGRCEVLPENERVAKPEGVFAGLEGLHVNKEGYVEDESGNVVGVVTEGNVKRLVGLAVDEDGDIQDKFGNTKGHAEPYEEAEPEAEDYSSLEGCTVNKAGNIVDSSGVIRGRVSEGDVQQLIGKKVDGKGQIWDNSGNVVGRAEVVRGQDASPEGPFAGFDDAVVSKEGTIVTPAGDIIGRIVEGDVKKLVNHHVDESGDILDKNGNVIGKAERWEPEQKEKKISPMSGRHVNKEGEVRNEDGDVIGRLTAGDLGHCVGCEIDDSGNVVDNDGNKIGEVTLLENIIEEEEEGPTEEEQQRQQEREIAEKMANICTQTLERIQPVCKQITEHIEKADRTPREELDEEELVNNVKPLIEEGGRILQECNGSLRGLDPDGHIAAQAKGRSGTKECSPEEQRLAETLKELTTTVVTTIDNAKKRISDMPHAKKKLNPLWGLLTQPLFQILAAVGLLLAGVLGLVGQLLNGLGLGGLVNGLLGGLGIDKLLGGLGLGGLFGGDDKKKKKGKGGVSNLPLVGGLLGGGK